MPAAVSDVVVENAPRRQIVLPQNIIARDPAAFPLSGQKAHPVQRQIFAALILIFEMIPNAVQRLEQLVPDFFAVLQAVPLIAAQLQPPIAGGGLCDGAVVMILMARNIRIRIMIRPGRRCKRNGAAHIPCGKHQAVAHGVIIRYIRSQTFAKDGLALPAVHHTRPRLKGQHTVACRVDKNIRRE